MALPVFCKREDINSFFGLIMNFININRLEIINYCFCNFLIKEFADRSSFQFIRISPSSISFHRFQSLSYPVSNPLCGSNRIRPWVYNKIKRTNPAHKRQFRPYKLIEFWILYRLFLFSRLTKPKFLKDTCRLSHFSLFFLLIKIFFGRVCSEFSRITYLAYPHTKNIRIKNNLLINILEI